jgi:hypothetical protein
VGKLDMDWGGGWDWTIFIMIEVFNLDMDLAGYTIFINGRGV